MTDAFEVSGIRAKLETLAASVFANKIDDAGIRELFSKINARYMDKRAADVFNELQEFFGRCYMVALQMKKEAQGEKVENTGPDKYKREATEAQKRRRRV